MTACIVSPARAFYSKWSDPERRRPATLKKITIICPYDDTLPLQVTSYRAFMPRYGMLTVADAMRRAGYSVTAFCELSGSRIHWPTVFHSDAVCFSLMSFGSLRGYAYADRIRKRCPGIPVIFGGSHASVLPEDCLDHCDFVVKNEGEATIVDLLNTIFSERDAVSVNGVAFKNRDGTVTHTPPRAFIESLDFIADPSVIRGYSERNLGFYIKDTLRNGVPRFNVAVTQGSRGCPFGCTFCFVKQELGTKYRKRDPDLVLREIELSLKHLKTRYIFFADNDLTLDREHAMQIFERIEKRFGGNVDLFFFSRITIARDRELMRAIERAGRACIALGVESVEPDTLLAFDKKQTVEDIRECLDLFAGFRVKLQLLFVFGSDTDTVDRIRKAVDFVVERRVYNWGFCSLYDFPTKQQVLGAPQSLPDHRFIHRDWRFYSGNFVVHYPRNMKPSTLQREMSRAYRKFYAGNPNAFYQYHPIQATYKYYLPLLERAEAGLYTRDEILKEDLLPGPMAMAKELPMNFSRAALASELARFYAGNLTRPQSWAYLSSLFNNKPGGPVAS